MSLEYWMRLNSYFNKQITSRSTIDSRLTLVSNSYALSIVNTSWNRYLNSLLRRHITSTTTSATFLLDNLTRTITVRTCCDILHNSKESLLCHHNLTFTITFRTCTLRSSWLSATTVTCRAWVLKNKLYLFLAAECRFFKCNDKGCSDILTLHWTVRTASATAESKSTEQVAEYIAKYI